MVVTDINETALENTRLNFMKHSVTTAEILYSDVFNRINKNEKFNIIYWLVPYFYIEEDSEVSMLEHAVLDPGYKAIERFMYEAQEYLKPSGQVFMGVSIKYTNMELLNQMAQKKDLKLIVYWQRNTKASFGETDATLIEVLQKWL